jgi:hypothetical protein
MRIASASSCDARDVVEEPCCVLGVLSCVAPPLGVPMDRVLGGDDRRLVDRLGLDVARAFGLKVKHPRFVMVYPDDRMPGHSSIFDLPGLRSFALRGPV